MYIIENIINSLELLSDKKSFALDVRSTRANLWLLIHFKHLKIKTYRIIYRINNGTRQRNSTVHPIRTMKKKFYTTDQFLTYIGNKSYDLLYVEFEFTNGWKIKEQPQIKFYFYTNSTKERDELIDKFFLISGQEPIEIENLIENISYYFNADGTTYILDDMPGPDEFWSEERKDKWKKEYTAKYYNEQPDGFSSENQFESIPF